MKIQGTPTEVYDKLSEYIDNNSKKEKLIAYIGQKETKEMLNHNQRKMFRGLFSEISNHIGEDPEQIKQNFLKGLFGVKTITTGKLSFENAIKPTTSELTKKETVFFIDSIMQFIDKYGVPCKYTSLEIQSLYNSCN